MTQVTICTKPSEFFQIFTDDQHVIHRIEKSRKKILHFNSMKDLVLNEILNPEEDPTKWW